MFMQAKAHLFNGRLETAAFMSSIAGMEKVRVPKYLLIPLESSIYDLNII